jgi:hypothetical protein
MLCRPGRARRTACAGVTPRSAPRSDGPCHAGPKNTSSSSDRREARTGDVDNSPFTRLQDWIPHELRARPGFSRVVPTSSQTVAACVHPHDRISVDPRQECDFSDVGIWCYLKLFQGVPTDEDLRRVGDKTARVALAVAGGRARGCRRRPSESGAAGPSQHRHHPGR